MARNVSQPSNMATQGKFANPPSANIQRSRMDRSHGLKTSFGEQYDGQEGTRVNGLIPVFWDEVLPGDSFHMNQTGFVRLATPLHPIMDNLFVDVHYFFVPYRLVWDHWQEFMGERRNPNDDPNDFSIPTVPIPYAAAGTQQSNISFLCYYFGLPMASGVGDPGTLEVSALPFRAYRLIWNEWYRDENLQNEVSVNMGDGPDNPTVARSVLPRGKRKDYFTSALPWPQKGDPVTIPVELEGQISTYANPQTLGDYQSPASVGGPTDYESAWIRDAGGNNLNVIAGRFAPPDYSETEPWASVNNNTTINDLRTAFQIQKLLERDARGGTRYIELIQSHFGVTSDDARLQRPEYLGGGSSRVSINPIANTAGVGDTNRPEGALGAVATSVNNARWSKGFTEHGIVIGLASFRADLSYQRGVERMWSRRTRYDFYWPALAHLGEQAILGKEISWQDAGAGNMGPDDVFAYQERYGEYRFKPSRVTGIFNSDAEQSLDAWHLAQDLTINGAGISNLFIHELPPIDRAIAVPSEPWFIADFWFDLKCDRPMPMYSVPGLVDHF